MASNSKTPVKYSSYLYLLSFTAYFSFHEDRNNLSEIECCSISVLSNYWLAINSSPFLYLKWVLHNILYLSGYCDL